MACACSFLALAGQPDFCLAGCAQSHAIKPVTQQIGIAQRPRAACKHEKGGLKRILSVLVVAQYVSADEKDHRAVSGDERGKGRFTRRVMARDKPIDDLPIG
jgi:hypothetical protein